MLTKSRSRDCPTGHAVRCPCCNVRQTKCELIDIMFSQRREFATPTFPFELERSTQYYTT